MPTATSSGEEPKAPESRPMSRLEIGLIVGVSALFITLIFLIFLIRALDQRRRKKVLRRMAEDARNRTPEEEMLRRRLAWLQVERIMQSLRCVWVDKDNNPTDPPPEVVEFHRRKGRSPHQMPQSEPQSKEAN
ncbi:hypothetical protein H9Q69_011345 [Fusarium xylarioides]|uniref:Uncharacterized protein n=1 Tax=Fusarium xylarioides TaxID=221167 RepID=A0A9P7I7A0_9HYPO|nr:hypothetical protein H9Q70_011383 [Fusarium xylarioides]KAG5771332.1 hypothetical protein H9Q72_002073 [Fusarium xylarioides]KAG5773247.1 hypothetical protein H9Q73_012208 [Fusarium xylarioides]KAG5789605.1 hypothetical protein H9Q69_011345 [Fusarium xylarioides]KAG5802407.1 hypothetical protein H9Q71_013008 [Fusarium xylarioides]